MPVLVLGWEPASVPVEGLGRVWVRGAAKGLALDSAGERVLAVGAVQAAGWARAMGLGSDQV